MSTRLREKIEKIELKIAELADYSADSTGDILIVVEGKKDILALRNFGLTCPILGVKTGGKSFAQALQEVEKTGAARVILLLDFDRRGKQGTKRLKDELEREKIKVDLDFWHDFFAVAGREIQCIESLPSYLENLREKQGRINIPATFS